MSGSAIQPTNLSGVKTGKPCLISDTTRGYKNTSVFRHTVFYGTFCDGRPRRICMWTLRVSCPELVPHQQSISTLSAPCEEVVTFKKHANTQESLQRGPERKSLKQTKSTEIRVYQPDQLMCLCLKRKWVDFAWGVSLYKQLHHRNSPTASSWYIYAVTWKLYRELGAHMRAGGKLKPLPWCWWGWF